MRGVPHLIKKALHIMGIALYIMKQIDGPDFFLRPYFNWWFSSVHNCEDRLYSFLQLHCTYMIFICLQSHKTVLPFHTDLQSTASLHSCFIRIRPPMVATPKGIRALSDMANTTCGSTSSSLNLSETKKGQQIKRNVHGVISFVHHIMHKLPYIMTK